MTSLKKDSFAALFCANTKRLRESTGVTQERMATALGVTLSAYKRYETRTPLPHKDVPAFALLCGVSIDEVFAVQGKEPDLKARAMIRIRGANQ